MKKNVGVIFEQLAKEKGISIQQLRADMIVAIHAAATSQDEKARRNFKRYSVILAKPRTIC